MGRTKETHRYKQLEFDFRLRYVSRLGLKLQAMLLERLLLRKVDRKLKRNASRVNTGGENYRMSFGDL